MLLLDRSWTRRLERITAPASTSSPSSDVSARIASIESRQNEIASTLGGFAQSLNGKSLNAAWRSLVAEAQKNRAATASAIEGLKAQAAANQKLVSQVGGVVQRCILSSWVVRRRHFFWTVSALVLDGVVGLGFLRFCWFGYFMSECVLR